jgi:antitoxin VapB
MDKMAKIFVNGRSQAVRLPMEFRFDETEVFVRRDPETGDVILSRKPADWASFFLILKGSSVPKDFLDSNDRNPHPSPDADLRDPFEDWKE